MILCRSPLLTRWRTVAGLLAVAVLAGAFGTARAEPAFWAGAWPNTDFSKRSIDFDEILSGGPPKDGIPAIDDPRFVKVGDADKYADTEPVISVTVNGQSRAYPLQILIWHEIVNDTLGDVPITVTYCPLCNSSIVFDRRMEDQVLDFGTTGKLRNSDLVMYDRQTESWWQLFLGEGIVGEMTGKRLKMLPSRVEPFATFKTRFPDAEVQVPSSAGMRAYGANPYRYYDSAEVPFLYRGDMPKGIKPMVRVVVVAGEAWSLPLLRAKGTIATGDLTLSWRAGMNSALDSSAIRDGRDVGSVAVQRRAGSGLEDVVHDVTFAFVFNAFHPDGVLHTQ